MIVCLAVIIVFGVQNKRIKKKKKNEKMKMRKRKALEMFTKSEKRKTTIHYQLRLLLEIAVPVKNHV